MLFAAAIDVFDLQPCFDFKGVACLGTMALPHEQGCRLTICPHMRVVSDKLVTLPFLHQDGSNFRNRRKIDFSDDPDFGHDKFLSQSGSVMMWGKMAATRWTRSAKGVRQA